MTFFIMGDFKITLCKYGTVLVLLSTIIILQIVLLTRSYTSELSPMSSEDFVTDVLYSPFFFTKEEHEKYRNLTKMERLYDRCCKTNTTWISPQTMKDVYGIERTLAQFQDKKQFFKHDECSVRDPDCSCLCAVERVLVSGVYINSGIKDRHSVGTFVADSCCKCLHQ